MTLQKHRNRNYFERYNLDQSPLAQNPTQKDIAELLGLKKSKLEAIITYKENFIIRRSIIINGKLRNLAYPFGRLRAAHEKLKFHLNKIVQPNYLLSPRKKRSQRDNAIIHRNQRQYLRLDIKQFYPSTSSEHVYRWARFEMGMRDDVAGLITHLVTVDKKASFGSPLTPVLTSLVHRKMFDAISDQCKSKGLKMTLWVDDIIISGNFIPGLFVETIRKIVALNGLKTHKLKYLTGSRTVIVTGIAIRGNEIDASRKLHNQIKINYDDLSKSETAIDAEIILNKILGSLGRYRFIAGSRTQIGRRVSNKINTMRQKKTRLVRNQLR